MSDAFQFFLRVRYGECDAQKVVFNSRYGEYVDVAVNEFIRAIGFGPALISGELDFQLVKQTIEWKGPARFDQVLALSVRARHVGHTPLTLLTELRIAGAAEDDVIATAETVYVLVESKTLKKTPIPSALRAAFEHGAPGRVTDHAGYTETERL